LIMSTVRIEKYTMPAANLGQENPLPMLNPRLSATAGGEVDENVPIEDRKSFGYGLDAGWLPHRGQDNYDRNRANRDFVALVLENEFLRATLLPEVGGRLWSLVHKPTGRELLFVNPVFQPANLAVRGAWVTGGVEWNACVYGHSPYTCSSLYAAEVAHKQAGEILRLYEWDRTRCVPFQLDFSLPDGSPFLFVRIRLVNPHAHTIPMYWWSNITVPESPDVRVIAPAERAYTYEYWGTVRAVSIPQHRDLDITYSTNIPYGADYFLRIPDGARPWIAALDRDGRGLIQTSTARQIGRKLFAWGTQAGGRRWKEFLSAPGRAYLEIQAGLSRTQMECAPMPAGAKWEWTEAYGLMEADPRKVHGSNWGAAVGEVADRLERNLPQESLDDQLRQTAALADRPPERILHRGSGWGALEKCRRERFGEPSICSAGLVFDDESLSDEQAPWLSLLQNRTLPEREPDLEPGAWMVQREWRDLLEISAQERDGDHWLTHLHLGLMYFAEGRTAEAEGAWQQSLRRRQSGWAYRNLAVLRKIKGRDGEALSFYEKAYQLLPELRPLLVEYCESLLAAGRAAEVLEIIESLSNGVRHHSRVRLLEARAGLEMGLPDRCLPILRDDYELVDIREGESSLTDLWFELRMKAGANGTGRLMDCDSSKDHESNHPLPSRLDFQVMPDPRCSAFARQEIRRPEAPSKVGWR
jgi:tetratricopeptide (TPR) repeat protein